MWHTVTSHGFTEALTDFMFEDYRRNNSQYPRFKLSTLGCFCKWKYHMSLAVDFKL